MPQTATLTVPIAGPSAVTFDIEEIILNKNSPAIKITIVLSTGEKRSLSFTVTNGTTKAQIITGLSFINQGKFMTQQGITLEDWLMKKISTDIPGYANTVSGTPF